MFTKKDKEHVIIIGGSNVDIKGRPKGTLIQHTSNPGIIEFSVGGVARNIAENVGRLNIKTTLLTSIGQDEYGKLIEKRTSEAGVDMKHIIRSKEFRTGIFMAVMNNKKDLETAICDMGILELITPEFVLSKEDLFKEASIVVVDDIPRKTLECVIDLCQEYKIPLCVEPVSVKKASHVKDLIDKITIITPNKEEADVLAETSIEDMEGVVKAGEILLNRGIKMAVITLGAEGVYLATKEDKKFIPSIATVVMDSVGAGDALVGGMVYGLVKGQTPISAIGCGVAAATITLKSREAVSTELCIEKLEKVYSELLNKNLL
jgi:pseudouridine kinase